MKAIPDSVISIAACSGAAAPRPPMPNRISMASAFLRKLSFSAEHSWQKNRGANRREDMSGKNIECTPGFAWAGHATPQW